jgi:hypothetical protein
MNEQTRYVMAIYQLSAVIRDTMEYLLPNNSEEGYSVDVYKQRKDMFFHLIAEDSPFAIFCRNNKEIVKSNDPSAPEITVGDRISNQVHELYEDVYGENPRIVSIDHEKIRVDTSLSLQLLDYVVGLHETLSDVCLGFMNTFKKEGTLEDKFEALMNVDDPYYRSNAFRVVIVNFLLKFNEFNAAVRSYISNEREKNGVDPSTQPGFDPKVDPSCAFINTEMNRIVGFYNFLKAHNKTKDIIFTDCITRSDEYFHYFDGTRKLAEGQKFSDVMGAFENTFTNVLSGYRDAWVRAFTTIFNELAQYEQKLIKERGEKVVEPAPKQEESKAE